MKQIASIAAALGVMIGTATAAPIVMSVTTRTNNAQAAAATNESQGTRGYVDTVLIQAAASSTVNVSLVAYSAGAVPGFGTVLYANAALATNVYVRPRYEATDNAGAVLTTDPPARHWLGGDTIILTVVGGGGGASNSAVYKAVINAPEK